jgi:hypothetical protein
MAGMSFAEAFAQYEKKQKEAQAAIKLIDSKNPELYAPLLMPPDGYFDHIGARRAKRASERVDMVVKHITTVPENLDLSKPGAKSSIRTFGVPASSLYNSLEFPPPGWKGDAKSVSKVKAGIEGEELTAKALAQWADDKPDVVICHSVSIPRKEGDDIEAPPEVEANDGETPDEVEEERKVLNGVDEDLGIVDTPDTDHVVVVGSQVWIIDSKMWKAGVDLNDPRAVYSFKAHDYKRKKRSNFSIIAPGSKRPRYVRMKQAIYLWRKYLGGSKRAHVRGIVNIHPKEVKNPDYDALNTAEQPEMIPGTIRFLRLDEWYDSVFKPTEHGRFIELLDEQYKKMKPHEKGFIDVGLVTLVARTPVKKRTRAEEFFGDKLKGFA